MNLKNAGVTRVLIMDFLKFNIFEFALEILTGRIFGILKPSRLFYRHSMLEGTVYCYPWAYAGILRPAQLDLHYRL